MQTIRRLLRLLLLVGLFAGVAFLALQYVRGAGPFNPYSYSPKNVPGDSFTLRIAEQDRVWRGFVPDGGQGPLPTVILLHGSGRTGLSMIDMWQDTARRYGLILIAPDSADIRGWGMAVDGPDVLTAVLRAAAETYAIDPDNIFLFGHSSGAMHAQMIADRTDGPWRAVVGHAGFVGPDMLTQTATSLPMLFLLGSNDDLFGVPAAEVSVAAFSDIGHPSELRVIGDHTHWYYDAAPQINELAVEFMTRYGNGDFVDAATSPSYTRQNLTPAQEGDR